MAAELGRLGKEIIQRGVQMSPSYPEGAEEVLTLGYSVLGKSVELQERGLIPDTLAPESILTEHETSPERKLLLEEMLIDQYIPSSYTNLPDESDTARITLFLHENRGYLAQKLGEIIRDVRVHSGITAELTGTTGTQLRYWEQIGLFTGKVFLDEKYKQYTLDNLTRIFLIKQIQDNLQLRPKTTKKYIELIESTREEVRKEENTETPDKE